MTRLLPLLLLLALPAHADTITLGPKAGSGALQEFIDVPNDVGARIDIYPAEVIIDGVRYPTGTLISVNLVETTYRTCNHSGRGQTCLTHYSLVSGVIVR